MCMCSRTKTRWVCPGTTHTGCPPDDRSFPSFNLSLSSKLSRIPSSCRASVAPRTNRFINGEGGNSLLFLFLSLPSRTKKRWRRETRQIFLSKIFFLITGGGKDLRNTPDSSDLPANRGDRCVPGGDTWNGIGGLIA